MNILDGFKTLYTAGGGQENLDELQGNKDQNMHSVIYGDGLYTTLPSNIENDVLSIAKGGGGGVGDFVITHLGTGSYGGIVGDMTYGEICTAMDDGKILIALFNNEYSITAGFVSKTNDRLTVVMPAGWVILMNGSSGNDNNIWSTQD